MTKDLFSENDKLVLINFADTIDSGLTRIANEIPSPESVYVPDISENINYLAEQINEGLSAIASSIDRLAQSIEDKK